MSNFVGCFLTGSAAEVTPVACIDKYNFKVCNVIEDIADSYQGVVRKKKKCGLVFIIFSNGVIYSFYEITIAGI